MSKNLSAKYYRQNKERLPKKFVKDINVVLKKKKKKSNKKSVKVTKISHKMKKKLVEYKKRYYRIRKNSLL